MSEMITNAATCIQRPVVRQVRRALIFKEWIEHRWRFALGSIVLSVLLGGMLRAQIIPYNEAAVFVFWPVGTLMTIFLAMGPVAMEKTGHTWEFLLAQPVPRFHILLAKWRMGMYELLGMNCIAFVVGLLAMWSRGFYGRASLLDNPWEGSKLRAWLDMVEAHPGGWLFALVMASTAALACWYTFLFFVLTRARNEFTAALGGLLLTIAAHVWLGQWNVVALRIPVLANPFATFWIFLSPERISWLPLVIPVQLLLWIGGTLWVVRRLARRQSDV